MVPENRPLWRMHTQIDFVGIPFIIKFIEPRDGYWWYQLNYSYKDLNITMWLAEDTLCKHNAVPVGEKMLDA